MKSKRKQMVPIIVAVVLNIALIICVLFSVISALNDAEAVSFSQNIENVRTLSDSSANKVKLVYMNHDQEILSVANYINTYNGVGMTLDELCDFFADFYSVQDDVYSWELVDNTLNGVTGNSSGFNALALGGESTVSFFYKHQIYPDLARLFSAACEESIGTNQYTNEFTDCAPSTAKVSAVTTTVRVLCENGYEYKTLMRMLDSSYINSLISSNNDIDTLSFFDYSNVIVDSKGNYVISSNHFQGTNFLDYIALYNDDFTPEDSSEIVDCLNTEDYTGALYYKNNRGQDCVYTIVPIQNSEWHILSLVPLDSFHNAYNFNSSFLTFAFYFGLLFLVDIVFVMDINRQLRRRTKEAQAASIAKTDFLSSMSHDIRTPMNAIIGMTFIADENIKNDSPDIDVIKDCIKTIQRSGNHLLTLINDILDISKIENGKVVLSEDDFSIAESMSKLIEIVQPQIKTNQLNFETHIMNVTHEFVHADELRINQIYINILSNAIKYTHKGGKITVDLTEEAVPGRSTVSRFIYKVSDTGIGMDAEFLKTIFDPFSRAVDTRVNTAQGTGLGMSITKQLVDLMGGTIQVESELNVGSTFTVSLELSVSDIETENVSLQGMSALLIDDDPILLKTAMLSLAHAGMSADTAECGEDGIALAEEKLHSTPYDVILVDWKMSGMDGLHVIRELRRRLGNEVKIIVMSAYSITDIDQNAHIDGVDGFISKPLFQSKLLHTIQSQFTGKTERPQQIGKPCFDMKVLVAEDNGTNWKVLSKILDHFGIHADRVVNGQEAVNAVKNSSSIYELVLMDIQMPVMNGNDAARTIRTLEDPGRAYVPIYAMTADTFAEDVDKCRESGMNGHLAKPIEIDKLLKVLTQISDQSASKHLR